jgi:hypothetical protein
VGSLDNWEALADGTAIEDEAVTTRMLSPQILDLLAYGIKGTVEYYADLPDPETLDESTVYAVTEDDGNPAGLYAVVVIGGSPDTKEWALILRAISSHPSLDNLSFVDSGHTGFQPAVAIFARAPTADDDEANTSGDGTFQQGYFWYDTAGYQVYICNSATEGAAVWDAVQTDFGLNLNGFEDKADSVIS